MTLHYHTPILENRIANRAGRTFLKMDCYQPAGSFKIRGVGYLCTEAVKNGCKHFVSSSGGNAGYAVAYAGRRLNAKVTVVVPETTSSTAKVRIQSEGAEVIVHGKAWDEANAYSLELAGSKEGIHIHPFDDPRLWVGHSTIIDEIVHDGCKPDTIVLSVGGGGLLAGVIEGLNRHGWNDVKVVAVETEGADSLAAALNAGRVVPLERITSVATSLGAKQVAQRAFDVMQSGARESYVVSDKAACKACARFADDFRVLVEPACGASLSLMYNSSSVIGHGDDVLYIVCGGIGVTAATIATWQ